jgi:predicted phosphate transport protein (TIGR00153 family)
VARLRLFGTKDEQLFMLFSESARVVVRGGDILQNVVNDYNDLDIKMAKLTAMEHEGDRIIQELIRRLNTSFILPFDREDAFQLAQQLSTTLDYITGIIDRMILYKTGRPNKRVKEMVNVLCEALLLQERALNLLQNLEHNKREILECCEEIRRLERKQDNHYRQGLALLFENQEDPIIIIKWREVYEHIEMAQDYVQDVAELISNICVKYS